MPCCRDRYRTLLRGIFPKGTTGRENDLEAQSVGRLADYAKRYPGKLPRIAGCARPHRQRPMLRHCRLLPHTRPPPSAPQ